MGWGVVFVQVSRVLVQEMIFQMYKIWTMQYLYEEGVSEEGEFFLFLFKGVF